MKCVANCLIIALMNIHLSFQTMITLAYTIPNIYVFIRIWQLSLIKEQRVLHTVPNIPIASIYPLIRQFDKGNFVFSSIRQWRFPVRTTAKSEIMVIDIIFTGQ